jgi:hypothetical protein
LTSTNAGGAIGADRRACRLVSRALIWMLPTLMMRELAVVENAEIASLPT